MGRGAAVGDLDNDGAVDIVTSNIGQNAYVLHNNVGARNHWIGLVPRGTRSNRDGIGCRVKVVSASGLTQFYTVNTAGSYLSASDRRLLIGLGADKSVKLIEARWPSGAVQSNGECKVEPVAPAGGAGPSEGIVRFPVELCWQDFPRNCSLRVSLAGVCGPPPRGKPSGIPFLRPIYRYFGQRWTAFPGYLRIS